ncbi:MAG: hypothetical protein F2813_01010 [Actinobacteria bacterium]|uniref:Unannotated protein n=1 Tax=freshwater metagenome TaxID=449393 RepID=A0A6J5Z0Q3_9ZZZZ|nr:hypothetical protein [Actinomycetota bacterium]
MGRRSRRRSREGDAPTPMPDAPTAEYHSEDGMVLELGCVMSPKTRAQYQKTIEGNLLSQEDAWHRAMEFLFERLALSWTINGVSTEGQSELLARLRMASQEERQFVRSSLREHCKEWFPDIKAP